MAQETFAGEQFVAELSRLGAAKVRERHTVGAWGKASRKARLVELWLAEQDRASAAATESEQTELVRNAKDFAKQSAAAAERSADIAEAAHATAKDANIRAAWALALAAASLVVQVMLAFVRPS